MIVQRPAGSNKVVVPPTQSSIRTIRLSRVEGQSLGFNVSIRKSQDFLSKGSVVSVSAVEEGGLGEKGGIHVDDRILEINGMTISLSSQATVIELLRRPDITLQVKAKAVSRRDLDGSEKKAETGDCTIC